VRIFSTKGTRLVEIIEEQFPLESEVQRLTEANLQELFGLVFVKSEFELIDVYKTLILDEAQKIFELMERELSNKIIEKATFAIPPQHLG